MYDDRFDNVARELARGRSRRAVLTALLGGVATGALFTSPADAARRGFAGPFKPTPVVPSDHCPSGTDCQDGICCAPDGSFCAGSGANCNSTADCPVSDEICHGGQCWLACNPLG
jgi:hypothetical protein